MLGKLIKWAAGLKLVRAILGRNDDGDEQGERDREDSGPR